MCRDNETYDRILELVRESGLSSHDADAFYAAYEQAVQSDFGLCKIGCVIVSSGRIVGRGFNSNKSDPIQRYYNLRYRDFAKPMIYSNREHSIHAEMAALKSISYPVAQKLDWSKAKAYVYRISPGLPFGQGLAAPCGACAHALKDRGVRKVFFSTDYGFATSVLSNGSELLSNG